MKRPIHFYALPEPVWIELLARERPLPPKERAIAWNTELNAAIKQHGIVDEDWNGEP